MDTLTLYFDRCFGTRLPETIRRAQPDFRVQYHLDRKGTFKFKGNTPDDEWLAAVGREKWIVLSHDRKWHNVEAEIDAIRQYQIGCFYLWGNNMPTWLKLYCFMRAHEKIISVARTVTRPFIFDIDQYGRLRQMAMR